MKYLIIKCYELSDQYECDADRVPVCVTNNCDSYINYGYEIYEINADGTLTLIQNYYDYEDQSLI